MTTSPDSVSLADTYERLVVREMAAENEQRMREMRRDMERQGYDARNPTRLHFTTSPYDGSVQGSATTQINHEVRISEDQIRHWYEESRVVRYSHDLESFCRAMAEENARVAYNSILQAWQTELVRYMEREVNPRRYQFIGGGRRSGRSVNVGRLGGEYAAHAHDLWNGFIDGPREKPTEAVPVAAVQKYPKEITVGSCKAELLADTMQLWEESENMRNCVYKSYTNKIERGEYIIYHVTAVDFKASGYTVGFSKSDNRWVFSQVKGKANSRLEDRNGIIDNFIKHIAERLNA